MRNMAKLVALVCLVIAVGLVGQGRFDYLVREDFFAGFAGSQERFDRAMKTCEEALAKNPKHAEAMAWHGSGLFFQAGQHFQKNDPQKGMEFWTRGLKEMDEAAALAPTNPGVIIPRAATLMGAASFAPPDMSKGLRERVVGDYEKVMEVQKAVFDKLGEHPRGELLAGLAENHHWMGNKDKSREYLQRIVQELPGSVYQRKAQAWLENPPTDPRKETMTCQGCHTK